MVGGILALQQPVTVSGSVLKAQQSVTPDLKPADLAELTSPSHQYHEIGVLCGRFASMHRPLTFRLLQDDFKSNHLCLMDDG